MLAWILIQILSRVSLNKSKNPVREETPNILVKSQNMVYLVKYLSVSPLYTIQIRGYLKIWLDHLNNLTWEKEV
jgi:hypothetical protein